jgi:hypothetical protein
VLRRIDWATPAIVLEKNHSLRRCTKSTTGSDLRGASIRPTGAVTRSFTGPGRREPLIFVRSGGDA